MFAACVITVLCLVSLTHSAPLGCEDLVQPLNQLEPRHFEGRWALISAGLTDPAHTEKFKTRDSAVISFVNNSETSKIFLKRSFGFEGDCQYLLSNISLEGVSFKFEEYNLTVTFLYTSCPDCLVLRFDDSSDQLKRLYIFSHRRELEQKELEEFRRQAECLNTLPPVGMDPNKELCPEQVSREQENTEGQKA